MQTRPMSDDEILAALKEDIMRAVGDGIPIRMSVTGITYLPGSVEMVYIVDPAMCGICAMGARLRNRTVNVTIGLMQAFAETVGRSRVWGSGFTYGSDPTYSNLLGRERRGPEWENGYQMGEIMQMWVADEMKAGRIPPPTEDNEDGTLESE